MQASYKWKVITIGEPTVGKTTLMLQYTERKFHELYIPTVGVQVSVKQVPIKIEKTKEKKLIELNIWDVAGHIKFQNIRKVFYEGAHAFLLLYDLTNKASYDGISYWYEDLTKIIGKQYGILIGNKKDLQKERVITEEEGIELATNLNLDFMETSAKTGENVNDVFEILTQNLLKMHGEK
ncbi:MAG TPA: Rab family GTPase [Candidatus Deferrimicrobium sp.]|nr:Rab family GTPase [Candidatus Deferrimicrobium sp.]